MEGKINKKELHDLVCSLELRKAEAYKISNEIKLNNNRKKFYYGYYSGITEIINDIKSILNCKTT